VADPVERKNKNLFGRPLAPSNGWPQKVSKDKTGGWDADLGRVDRGKGGHGQSHSGFLDQNNVE